jgi:hypothetical protein
MRARALGLQYCDQRNNGAEQAHRHVHGKGAEKKWVIAWDGYPNDNDLLVHCTIAGSLWLTTMIYSPLKEAMGFYGSVGNRLVRALEAVRQARRS